MARRILFAAAVVAVVVVAAVVLLDPGASRPAAGDYAGRSSQDLPFRLTVAPDRRTLTLDVRWRCGEQGVRMSRRRAVKVGRDGHFAWKGRYVDPVDGGDGDEERQRLEIAGRADADGHLKGTWHADLAYRNGESYAIDARCASGPVSFELSRRRGAPGTDDAGNRVIAFDGKVDKLAVGAGGAWVLARGERGQVLQRVDPETGRAGASTAVRTTVGNVIAAGEGAAWVLTFGDGPHNGLTRVDGRSGRVTQVLIPTPGPARLDDPPEIFDMAAGAAGVWLHRGDRVLRVDPRSGRVVRAIRLPGVRPAQSGEPCPLDRGDRIAVGAGAVWVTSSCGSRGSRFGVLVRIDPRTNRVTRTVALGAAYQAIAAGRLGVWGATPSATPTGTPIASTLQRIGTRDGRPTLTVPLPAGGAASLAVSRDAVWVTSFGTPGRDGGTGTLLRLDPASSRLSTALKLEQPYDMAVGERGVWVLDGFARTLTRLRP